MEFPNAPLCQGCSRLVFLFRICSPLLCGDTAQEKAAWIESLEAEENARRESVRAAVQAFEARQVPTRREINALLASAFGGQVTLSRASRVFPDRSAGKCSDVARAMAHGPTAALAGWLHHCWRSLGVTYSTLEVLLRQAVFTVGAETRDARRRLFLDLVPKLRRGVDPNAHAAFAAEGAGQSQMDFRRCECCPSWNHFGLRVYLAAL